jgi:hypothetical protein
MNTAMLAVIGTIQMLVSLAILMAEKMTKRIIHRD